MMYSPQRCRTCEESLHGAHGPHCESCAEYWKEIEAVDGIEALHDLLIRWYGPKWREALMRFAGRERE